MRDANPPRRKPPAKSDVVGTAILGAVGAFALVVGWGYGFLRDGGQVGPGFLPVATGGFILVASVAEIARMYFARPTSGASLLGVAESVAGEAKSAVGGGGEKRDTFGRTASERNRAILQVFALIFLALLLIPVIGLLLSLTALVLAVVLWVERKPVLPSVLATVGALAVAYLVFVQMLGVPAPQGMLGLI